MKLCMMSCCMGAASPEEIVKTAVDCGMSAVDWVTSCQSVDAEISGIAKFIIFIELADCGSADILGFNFCEI